MIKTVGTTILPQGGALFEVDTALDDVSRGLIDATARLRNVCDALLGDVGAGSDSEGCEPEPTSSGRAMRLLGSAVSLKDRVLWLNDQIDRLSAL